MNLIETHQIKIVVLSYVYGNSDLISLRLGAQSSYVVKYFEGSNAVKRTSMHN